MTCPPPSSFVFLGVQDTSVRPPPCRIQWICHCMFVDVALSHPLLVVPIFNAIWMRSMQQMREWMRELSRYQSSICAYMML